MTDILRAIVLGMIEALTEFLPISSTGHLILAAPLLGCDIEKPPWNAFLYFVQIGAILAVVVYFRGDLWRAMISTGAGRDSGTELNPTMHRLAWRDHLAIKLLAAFAPTVVIGLLLHDTLEKYLEKPVPIAIALLVGAVAMEWIEGRYRHRSRGSVDSLTLRQAFAIGLAQSVSIVPGTSRAMATIMGGMLVGLSPEAATRFSFYLAIPTLMAAGGYSLYKHRGDIGDSGHATLVVGFATAFVVAMFVVDGFMRFVRSRRLRPFAVYRVVLGLFILAAWAMNWM